MEEPTPAGGGRKKLAAIVFLCILLAASATVFMYLRYQATHVSTDDAYVEGSRYAVSSKIPGTVRIVLAADNQKVSKGDTLVEIDTADYDVKEEEASSGFSREQARLAEGHAALEAARKKLAELMAKTDAVAAEVELQQANLAQAAADAKRASELLAKGAISREKEERTATTYAMAAAQLKAVKEKLREAQSGIETQKAVLRQIETSLASQQSLIRQKNAELKGARLRVGYTKILAPADGYVTKKSVEPGTQVQAGQPLMAVVSLDAPWIVANYKETQLGKIKPGQKVIVKVDTYPDKEFKGTVQSIMAGTGAVFSLFPPENAAGNYVKVVQRVPVKILLDKDAESERLLRVGMSVVPTVLVQ